MIVNSTRYKINGAQAIAFTNTTLSDLACKSKCPRQLYKRDRLRRTFCRSVPRAGLAEHHPGEVNGRSTGRRGPGHPARRPASYTSIER